MQNWIIRLVLVLVFIFHALYSSQAQCTDRYLLQVFTEVDSTSDIIYTTTAGGASVTERLDIYQPHGDTAAARRLLVLAHGGAFFQGSKADGDMKYLCYRFAQLGYVCATIDYRLAPSVISLYDSLQDFKYMVWAMSDMKAAIRFFKQDYTASNTWRIDTSHIYIGGSSAGAIAADLIALLNSEQMLPPGFRALIDSSGGLDGNSGNPGYSTRPYAIASLAGAISDLRWIDSTSPPAFFSQGTSDRIVPYDCAYAFAGYTGGFLPTIRLCGSGMMAPAFASRSIRYALQSFAGADHVPWDTDPVIAYSMDSALASFFYTLDCQLPQGIPETSTSTAISIYPNPATDQIYVKSTSPISTATLCDMAGRTIFTASNQQLIPSFQVRNITPGIYLLRVESTRSTFTSKITIQ